MSCLYNNTLYRVKPVSEDLWLENENKTTMWPLLKGFTLNEVMKITIDIYKTKNKYGMKLLEIMVCLCT